MTKTGLEGMIYAGIQTLCGTICMVYCRSCGNYYHRNGVLIAVFAQKGCIYYRAYRQPDKYRGISGSILYPERKVRRNSVGAYYDFC